MTVGVLVNDALVKKVHVTRFLVQRPFMRESTTKWQDCVLTIDVVCINHITAASLQMILSGAQIMKSALPPTTAYTLSVDNTH
ncbi:hypothetical protein NPIL_307951 [Nephila pilipes]|uniref:Uncharacterized protein n=1 Tax=Nephila pilipes TaxID=299642 RepID=A0A8X6MK14_NEPPI|nr:hypothetical protein NPIL_307951 [Nephila pilipes]